MPQYDALVLTLCINDFDVHRVLVDPSGAGRSWQCGRLVTATCLQQDEAFHINA